MISFCRNVTTASIEPVICCRKLNHCTFFWPMNLKPGIGSLVLNRSAGATGRSENLGLRAGRLISAVSIVVFWGAEELVVPSEDGTEPAVGVAL